MSETNNGVVVADERLNDIERKVNEIHLMLSQFGQLIESLGSNPMIKAMLPPGVLGK